MTDEAECIDCLMVRMVKERGLLGFIEGVRIQSAARRAGNVTLCARHAAAPRVTIGDLLAERLKK